jgi:hypothetical protein
MILDRLHVPLLLLLASTAVASPVSAGITAYSIQSDGDDKLYRIDLQTGVSTPVGKTGYDGVESLSFDPGCKTLYGVDDVKDRLVTCDVATGACQSVGSLGVDITDTGLAFANDGNLYMSTDAPKNPIRFYRIDPRTGMASSVGVQGREVTGLAADQTGLYGLGGDGTDVLVTVDPASGAATVVGPLQHVTLQDGGLDFSHDGVLYGIDDISSGSGKPSQIFTIDKRTGEVTVVATTRDPAGKPIHGFEGLAIADGICGVRGFGSLAANIPTLSEWTLALLALALTAAGVRTLRKRAASL